MMCSWIDKNFWSESQKLRSKQGDLRTVDQFGAKLSICTLIHVLKA